MAAIDDLTTAITNLTASVDAAVAAGIGGTAGVPEAAVAQAATDVQAQADRLTAATPAATTTSAPAAGTAAPAEPEVSGNPPA